jgi:hypothetical protein
MTEPRHLSEVEIAASLMSGARRPVCPVPGCVSCAAKLDEAHLAAREFHTHVLPATLPQIRGRLSHAGRGWSAWPRWLVAPLAAAATVAIVLAVWPHERAGPPDDVVLRAKGGADARDQVEIFVQRDHAVHRLAPGDAVQPGDALRFVVDPGAARFVLVVSIDGALQVNTYYPFDGTASAALPPGPAPVALDDSVILDGVLGDERVWVLLSAAPVTVDSVRPQLLRLASAGAAAVAVADGDALTRGLPGVAAITLRLHKVRNAEFRPR